LNGKCRADFGDIRFADSDGVTELSYWMEEKVDSDYAVFWVKVPSIPASPDTATIYIYYGNSSATTTSDGDSTFLLWDDFSDASRWTEVDPNNHLEIDTANKRINVNGLTRNEDAYIYRPLSIGATDGIRYFFAAQLNSESDRSGEFESGFASVVDDVYALKGGAGEWLGTRIYNYQSRLSLVTDDQGNHITGASLDTVYYYTIIRDQNGNIKMHIYTDRDRTSEVSGSPVTLANPEQDAFSYFFAINSYNSGDTYAAYGYLFGPIWVTKYIDPEPSHGAWGAEEVLSVEYSASATVSINFTSTVSRLVEVARSADVSFSVGSTASRLLEFARSASSTLSFALSMAYSREYVRSTSVTLAFMLGVARQYEVPRNASLSISVSSQASRSWESFRSADVLLQTQVAASRVVEYLRSVAQGISVSPAIPVGAEYSASGYVPVQIALSASAQARLTTTFKNVAVHIVEFTDDTATIYVDGWLLDAWGVGVPQVMILAVVTRSGDIVFLEVAKTNTQGYFRTSNFDVELGVKHVLYLRFDGTDEYAPSEYQTSFTVQKEEEKPVPTPLPWQYYVLIIIIIILAVAILVFAYKGIHKAVMEELEERRKFVKRKRKIIKRKR